MIIAYYEQGHSKREMANKFEIEPKQLRDWLQNKDKLIKVAPYIQKLTPGSRLKYPELETELLNWFKKSRSQLKVVICYMIQVLVETKKIGNQKNRPTIVTVSAGIKNRLKIGQNSITVLWSIVLHKID